MKVQINHELKYVYEKDVSLGEHRICLKPRSYGFQQLRTFNLHIHPNPYEIFPLVSQDGDEIYSVKFEGLTKSLLIKASSEIETEQHPDIYMRLGNQELTLPYSQGELPTSLSGFLEGWLPNGQHDPAAVEIAQEALTGLNSDPLTFINQLIQVIKERVKYTERHIGPAWPAGRTLRERVGSCRDLAILMMEACRCVGIPSRFVSGYQLLEPPPDKYELHAWTEIYLPGSGWRGFDPSNNGIINENYITLVTSSKSESAAPVSGSFVGPPLMRNHLKWSIALSSRLDS